MIAAVNKVGHFHEEGCPCHNWCSRLLGTLGLNRKKNSTFALFILYISSHSSWKLRPYSRTATTSSSHLARVYLWLPIHPKGAIHNLPTGESLDGGQSSITHFGKATLPFNTFPNSMKPAFLISVLCQHYLSKSCISELQVKLTGPTKQLCIMREGYSGLGQRPLIVNVNQK